MTIDYSLPAKEEEEKPEAPEGQPKKKKQESRFSGKWTEDVPSKKDFDRMLKGELS